MRTAEGAAQGLASGEDRIRVDVVRRLAGDVPFAGQTQGLSGESRVEATRLSFAKNSAIGLDEFNGGLRRLPGPYRGDRPQQQPRRQALGGLPAVETVAIMTQKGQEVPF